MTILHFSDTHLGYNELDKIGTNGVNLREQDFYDAFTYVVDRAIELKPDLILHSGDFFHRPSPPNRPMIFALEQLNRLSKANLPIVIIAGNHSTPKTVYTSPILKAFKTIKGVYPIFNQQYETLEFGDLVIHGLPHINDEKILLQEMDKVAPQEGKQNILMLHTSIGKSFIMEEFGEQLFPPERLELLNRFDYVALGHWHNFQKVEQLNTAWYSGSTERMSDTEAGKKKGFCLFDLLPGQTITPVFHPVPARPWFRFDIKNCKDKTIEAIEAQLKEMAHQHALEGALVSVYLHRIQSTQSISLGQRRIMEMMNGAIHVQTKRSFAHRDMEPGSLQQSNKRTDQLLGEYIQSQVDNKERKEVLSKKAQEYFHLFESGEYKKR
ncbi:MAG: DNA repair exonuclease [Bacteroidota bacterium]